MEKDQKNIVIIGPAHPLRAGGMATFNERLALAFMDEGHNVRIDTFSLQYPSFLFPGSSQYSTEPAPPRLHIRAVINSINPFNWIKTGNNLRKERPDIIVVRFWLPFMGPCFGSILRIARKNKHTRVICIADNIIPHEKRSFDRPFTKYFVGAVDAFITMSSKVLQDLRMFTAQTPAINIPHPLYDNFGSKISRYEARQKLGIGDQPFVLLFFGFIRKYKGLDLLLQSLPLLKTKLPGIKLLIAGEFYEDRQEFDRMVEALNIQDDLILHTNFIASDDVKNYFCAADLVVQPYRNATQSGVTPLAYHFEIPMVVTNVGGLPELVPDGISGLVVEPNPQAIATAIEKFHELGSDYFLPGLIEQKKKYSWDKMVASILELASGSNKSS